MNERNRIHSRDCIRTEEGIVAGKARIGKRGGNWCVYMGVPGTPIKISAFYLTPNSGVLPYRYTGKGNLPSASI